MRRRTLAAILLCLLGAIGCGDPPPVVVRDTLTTMNELADLMLHIDDEDSAQEVLKTKVEPLKKKWEKVRKRQEEFSKFDKEQKDELREALEQLKPESKAAGKRLKEQIQRITAIKNRTRGSTKSLAEAAKLPEEFKPHASSWQPPDAGPNAWLDDPLKGMEPKKR
jgi:hypothetical protein